MRPARRPVVCYVTDRQALEAVPISSGASRSAAGNFSERSLGMLRECIRRAVAASAEWIQIREKDLEGRSLAALARFAVEEGRAGSARVHINDRLDVAVAARAAGVHLGEKSLPLESVVEWRRFFGPANFSVGVSCHSLEETQAAERGGADYVFFGPVFATPSKAKFGAPQGLVRLREVCAAVEIPVLAIGGVSADNARSCIEAGAAGVAAIRLFQDMKDEANVITRIRNLRAAVTL